MDEPIPRLRPDDPVSQHMRTSFARLHPEQTVAEAVVALRTQHLEGRIVYFYVLDEHGRLEGVVPTRALILSAPEQRLRALMVRPVVSVPIEATVLDACEFFLMHRLLALPVVDAEGRMVGVIDVELYTDEIEDLQQAQRSDDLFQLIGVRLSEARSSSPVAAFRGRLPWLLCNVAGGILAAVLASVFAEDLRRAVELALFVPVVLALAESVSVQSVSLALERLHGRRLTWAGLATAARRELATGGLLGLTGGAIVAAIAVAWAWKFRLGICLLLTITLTMALSALLGLALPSLIRMSRRDPRIASGPVVLATADMVTLLVYFSLARWLGV